MLLSLGLILLCQLVGEAIARGTGLAVPGPVIGLVLCVLLLLARDRLSRRMPIELTDGTFEQTGRGILSHLSLLFIPAGVGVIQRFDVLAGNALAITAAVVVSTVLSLAVTAWVFSVVASRTEKIVASRAE
jgi:putative effector of murein hydrolase LrgA (UPF0299 family)